MIADFESEVRKVCERHEKKISHAELVGVLSVVKHLYLDAQFENFKEDEGGSSPKPQEVK